MAGFVPKPGDLGLTPGMWLVRLGQTAPGERFSQAGHVFGFISRSKTLEAAWRVVIKPWAKRQGPCEVWRHKHLTGTQREAIAAHARAYAGRRYGWWKIGFHGVDWALAWARYGMTLGHVKGEVYAVRRILSIDDRPICSWVWAHAYRDAGIGLGEPEGCATPDGLRDFVSASDDWELVYERAA